MPGKDLLGIIVLPLPVSHLSRPIRLLLQLIIKIHLDRGRQSRIIKTRIIRIGIQRDLLLLGGDPMQAVRFRLLSP